MASCPSCGRLDPWRAKPCYCQRTTMRSKDKEIRLYYEHMTEGHPFYVKTCVACEGQSERRS